MTPLRLVLAIAMVVAATARAAAAPDALPRRAAPGGAALAGHYPETGPVDTAPFRLRGARWAKDAGGRPAAAVGIFAIPEAVQALTDLPAEWPARVVFEKGRAVAAQLLRVSELAIGGAALRQAIRPAQRGGEVELRITAAGRLAGHGIVGQLPSHGAWLPVVPQAVEVACDAAGHLDVVLTGASGARVFQRFGAASSPRPEAGTRDAAPGVWGADELWISHAGPIWPGFALDTAHGLEPDTWPAPLAQVVQDQLGLALPPGRLALAPVGEAKFSDALLWIDARAGRLSVTGSGELAVDETALALPRRLWAVASRLAVAIRASTDGVRAIAEADAALPAATVAGPPALTARLRQVVAALPAGAAVPRLELVSDIAIGPERAHGSFVLERYAGAPRLVLSARPALPAFSLPLAVHGASLSIAPERVALVAQAGPTAGVALEGQARLVFADVSLLGEALVSSGTDGALDLAITPPHTRLPALPGPVQVDFARTTGRVSPDGRSLALSGAVFTPVPRVLERVLEVFARSPARVTGRLTASAGQLQIDADLPLPLCDMTAAGFALAITGFTLRHAAGTTGWEPELAATLHAGGGVRDVRFAPAPDGSLAAAAGEATVALELPQGKARLRNARLALAARGRAPEIRILCRGGVLGGFGGELTAVALARVAAGWQATLTGVPEGLQGPGGALVFEPGELLPGYRGRARLQLPGDLVAASSACLKLPGTVEGPAEQLDDTTRVTADLEASGQIWPGAQLSITRLSERWTPPATPALALDAKLTTDRGSIPGVLRYVPRERDRAARLAFEPAARGPVWLPVPGTELGATVSGFGLELLPGGARVTGRASVAGEHYARTGELTLDWAAEGHGRLELRHPDLALAAGPLTVTPRTLAVDLPLRREDEGLPVRATVAFPASWPGLAGEEVSAVVDSTADGTWRLLTAGALPAARRVGTLPVTLELTSFEAGHDASGFTVSGDARLALLPPLADLFGGAGRPLALPARLSYQAGRVTFAVPETDAAPRAVRFPLPPLGTALATPRGLTLTFAGPHPEPLLMLAARLQLTGGPASADLLVSGNVGEGGLSLDVTAPDRSRGAVRIERTGAFDATARDLVFRALPGAGAVTGDAEVRLGGPTFGLRAAGDRVTHVLATAAPPAGLLFFDRVDLELRLFGLPAVAALALPLPAGPELARWLAGDPTAATPATLGPVALGLPPEAARWLPDLPLVSLAGRTAARLVLMDRPEPLAPAALADLAAAAARAFSGELAALAALVPPDRRSGVTRLRAGPLTGRAAWSLQPPRAEAASATCAALPLVDRLVRATAAIAERVGPLAPQPADAASAPHRTPFDIDGKIKGSLEVETLSLREPLTAALELIEQHSGEPFDAARALGRHLARIAPGARAGAGALVSADGTVELTLSGTTPPIVVRSRAGVLPPRSVPLLSTTTSAVPGQGTLEVVSALQPAGDHPVIAVRARLLPPTQDEYRAALASWTRARARWTAARAGHDAWQRRFEAEAAWHARRRTHDAWREAVDAYDAWLQREGARDAWLHGADAYLRWQAALRACMKQDDLAGWSGDPVPADCRANVAKKLGAAPPDPGAPPRAAGAPPAAPPPEPPAAGPRPAPAGDPSAPAGDEPPAPARPGGPPLDLGTVATLPLETLRARWQATYRLDERAGLTLTFSDLGTIKLAATAGASFTALCPGARLTALRTLLSDLAPLAPMVFEPDASAYRLGLAAWNRALVDWRDRVRSVQAEGRAAAIALADGARLAVVVDEAVYHPAPPGEVEDPAVPGVALARLVYDEARGELRAAPFAVRPTGSSAVAEQLEVSDLTVLSSDPDTRRLLSEHARQRERLEPGALDRLERLGLNLDGAPLAIRRLHVLYERGGLCAVLYPGHLAVLDGAGGQPLMEVDSGSLAELERVRAGGAPGDVDPYPERAGTFLVHAGAAAFARDVIPDEMPVASADRAEPVTNVVDLHLALGTHLVARTLELERPAELAGRWRVTERGQLAGTLAAPSGPERVEPRGDHVEVALPLAGAPGLARPELALSLAPGGAASATVRTTDAELRPVELGRDVDGQLDGRARWTAAPAAGGGLTLAGELGAHHGALDVALVARGALSSAGDLVLKGPAQAELDGRRLADASWMYHGADGLLVGGELTLPSAARVHVEGRVLRGRAGFTGELVQLGGESGAAGTLALDGDPAPVVRGALQVLGTPLALGTVTLDGASSAAELDLACAPAGLDATVRVTPRDAPDPAEVLLDGEVYLDTELGRFCAPLSAPLAADGSARLAIGPVELLLDLPGLDLSPVVPAEPAADTSHE